MSIVDYDEEKTTKCPKCGNEIVYHIQVYADGGAFVYFPHEDEEHIGRKQSAKIQKIQKRRRKS